MKERFSKKNGLQPVAAEIAIRYDAPEEFRRYLFFVMQNLGLGLKNIREIACIATKQAPDSNNWRENENKSLTKERLLSVAHKDNIYK